MRCSRMISAVYRKRLKPFNVTPSQLGILMMVNAYQQVPQSQLSKQMHVERSTLSRELKRLIDKDYIVKTGPATRPILSLTASGKEYFTSLVPAWEKAMDESTQILDEEGQQALNLVLKQLSQNT